MTNGLGSIRPAGFTGTQLEVGKRYSVLAVPGSGFVFSNWTGTVSSNQPTLTFTMQSNLVLAANFVSNPFVAYQGDYVGLFQVRSGATPTNCGGVALKITDKGAYTGKLVLGGVALPISGAFSPAGVSSTSVRSLGRTFAVLLVVDAMDKMVNGTVTFGNESATLFAQRIFQGATNPYAGTHTGLILGPGNDDASPGGDGLITLSVSPNGQVKAAVALADGTTLTIMTALTQDGRVPLYTPLQAGSGMLFGYLDLQWSKTPPFLWVKKTSLRDKYYPQGFTESRTAYLLPYTPPTPSQDAVNWDSAQLIVGGGNLAVPLTNTVVLTNDQIRLVSGSLSNLVVRITAKDGSVSGTFLAPGAKTPTAYKANLLQTLPLTSGGGFFLGTNHAGYFKLVPVNN
ncbi:MAG: hypothetical protein WCO56_21380 [Verrucomicrobiota bacterium]